MVYLKGLAKQLMKHPDALLEMRRGPDSVGARLLKLVGDEYVRHPVSRVSVMGFTIYLNPLDGVISGQIAIKHQLEPEVTPAFVRALRGASVVVDAGANIGWYTLIAARYLPRSGIVLAFEPDGVSLGLLLKSIKENRFTNVKTFAQALSNRIGEARLQKSPDPRNPGMHSIAVDHHTRASIVPTTTLDMVVHSQGIDTVDLLKLDVEGAEASVLNGAAKLLERRRIKHIFIEWNPASWRTQGALLDRLANDFNASLMKWGRTNSVPDLHSLGQRANIHLELR